MEPTNPTEVVGMSVSLTGNGMIVVMPKFADRAAFDKYGRAEVVGADHSVLTVRLYTDLTEVKRQVGVLPGYRLSPENGGVHWERRSKFQDTMVFGRKANFVTQGKTAVHWQVSPNWEDVIPHLELQVFMPEWFSEFMNQPMIPSVINGTMGQNAIFKRHPGLPTTAAPKPEPDAVELPTKSFVQEVRVDGEDVNRAIDLVRSMRPGDLNRFIRRMHRDLGITTDDFREVAGA